MIFKNRCKKVKPFGSNKADDSKNPRLSLQISKFPKFLNLYKYLHYREGERSANFLHRCYFKFFKEMKLHKWKFFRILKKTNLCNRNACDQTLLVLTCYLTPYLIFDGGFFVYLIDDSWYYFYCLEPTVFQVQTSRKNDLKNN